MERPDPSFQVVAAALFPLHGHGEMKLSRALLWLLCAAPAGFGNCSGCSAGFVSVSSREAVLGLMHTVRDH